MVKVAAFLFILLVLALTASLWVPFFVVVLALVGGVFHLVLGLIALGFVFYAGQWAWYRTRISLRRGLRGHG